MLLLSFFFLFFDPSLFLFLRPPLLLFFCQCLSFPTLCSFSMSPTFPFFLAIFSFSDRTDSFFYSAFLNTPHTHIHMINSCRPSRQIKPCEGWCDEGWREMGVVPLSEFKDLKCIFANDLSLSLILYISFKENTLLVVMNQKERNVVFCRNQSFSFCMCVSSLSKAT